MMTRLSLFSGFCGWILFASVSLAQNASSTTGASGDFENGTTVASNNSEIDFEALSQFGVSAEFAEQFKLNLIKAIEAAKEQDAEPPLRQGEFGGVSGGFYQGGNGGGAGGAGAGGAGGGDGDGDEYEDDDTSPTPGPGAFGVLSGLFGIFSGLGSLNPTRIIQSTVNFFPPGQRVQAQMIVDSLIGYTPPENRTARLRPRRRSTTTPLPMPQVETTMTPLIIEAKTNESAVVAKGGENGTEADAMSEVISAPLITTTPEPDFINVHELLNRTTEPPPPTNEDDEAEFYSKWIVRKQPAKVNSASGSAPYKLIPKGEPEEEEFVPQNATTIIPTSPTSQLSSSPSSA